jgi:hypothetical protein
MLKNLSSLEHVIEGKIYTLLCDPASPLNHVKDALVKFLGYVQNVEDQARATQEKAAEEQKPVEDHAVESEQPQEPILEQPQSE